MAEVFKEKTVKIHEATDKPIFSVMQEIAGISTDTKPTNVATGSVFFETDTTKIYIYDGENEEWNEVTCGGGGGGGDSDLSTAEVTLTANASTPALMAYINPGEMGYSTEPAIEILQSLPKVSGAVINVPLYKGCAIAYISAPANQITVTGDIEAQEADSATVLIISGNGSITILNLS